MSTSLLKPEHLRQDVRSKHPPALTGNGWGLVILFLMFIAVALLWIAAGIHPQN
jgi:hypothetical protein